MSPFNIDDLLPDPEVKFDFEQLTAAELQNAINGMSEAQRDQVLGRLKSLAANAQNTTELYQLLGFALNVGRLLFGLPPIPQQGTR